MIGGVLGWIWFVFDCWGRLYCGCWCFVCVIWLLTSRVALDVCCLGLAPQGWVLVSLRFGLYCLIWWWFSDSCVDFKL